MYNAILICIARDWIAKLYFRGGKDRFSCISSGPGVEAGRSANRERGTEDNHSSLRDASIRRGRGLQERRAQVHAATGRQAEGQGQRVMTSAGKPNVPLTKLGLSAKSGPLGFHGRISRG